MATTPVAPESNAHSDNPMLVPDAITTTKVSKNPCDVVSFVGYLGESHSSTYVRVYDDLTFREWTAVPADAIQDRAYVESVDGITKSVIWVDIDSTVVRCRSIPVSNYGSHTGAGLPPGDEDLGYEYPRRK